MNYLLNFIPGKNISTKSIHDMVVSCHFEVPMNFDSKKFIDKPLELVFRKINETEEQFRLDCYLSSEGNSYYYSGQHKNFCVKLDIQIHDSLMVGYIISNEYEKSLELAKDK